MLLHFGDSTAKEQGLYWDLEQKKIEFARLELMNPNRRVYKAYEKGHEEGFVNDLTEKLIQKTKNA